MSRLSWNQVGQKFYGAGLDRGVLYPKTGAGVPWNGLIAVEEKQSGGEHSEYFFDGIKYLDIISSESFQATLTAFYSPPEFDACDGTKLIGPGLFATNQSREMFDLSYRTHIGNDVDGEEHGYELHLVYNATASPTEKSRNTRGENTEPTNLTWTINAVPPPSDTFKPTSHFVISSLETNPRSLAFLESYLYGETGLLPTLPPLDTVAFLLTDVPITEPLAAFF